MMDVRTLDANNRVQADLLRQAGADSVRSNRALISPMPLHGEIASRVLCSWLAAEMYSTARRDGAAWLPSGL